MYFLPRNLSVRDTATVAPLDHMTGPDPNTLSVGSIQADGNPGLAGTLSSDIGKLSRLST